MSNYIFGNKNFSGTQVIDKEDSDEMNIYANIDDINSHEVCRGTGGAETMRNQTSQHTGSECVKNRSFRSVSVCLVVLCVLLLTAVIVLCVLIYTNNHQCHINSKNITEERDQLLFKYITVKKEKDGLLSSNTDLNKQRDQLTQQINELRKILNKTDGWLYFKSSSYYISSEKKSWTESRRYCTDKGADLIIINNKEELDLITKYFGTESIWIGLSDSDVEGTWKWVDGSTLTSSFWAPEEPNGNKKENCAETFSSSWNDLPCNIARKCICETKF